MEKIAVLLITALLTILLVRLLLLPVKWIVKIGMYSGCGFLCLWLLNTTAPITGITVPMNALTVWIAGFLGLPGIGLLVILTVL